MAERPRRSPCFAQDGAFFRYIVVDRSQSPEFRTGSGGLHLDARGLRSAAVLAVLALALPLAAHAQTVTATLAVGTTPLSVAVNPVTNNVYVANYGSNTVRAIDGATNHATTVAAGTGPNSVAVNAVTNMIYVTNSGSNTVTVINGATNGTTTVAVGTAPISVAVNPVTNKIYVANGGSGTVTVINGATNSTATVAVGSDPCSVAVNPVTNVIYVANQGSGSVTVINGANNSTATVVVGSAPSSVAVNPATNQIYVANEGSGNVTVINGANNSATAVTAGKAPYSVAVNPATNEIYVANYSSANVTVIEGGTNITSTVAAGTNPTSVAVNPMTNQIYVADQGSGNVTVINGASNSPTTIAAGSAPDFVTVNPVTNKIYVANSGSADMTVIDGATNNTATTVAAGSAPYSAAVNPVTNMIYVAGYSSSDSVTVIDGATNSPTTVTVGENPFWVAVNPVTNMIYVANRGGNTVTVIDGATNSPTTITVGSNPYSVAVNPVTNMIYVANSGSDSVTVIDGATNSITATVAVGGYPISVAVNPATNTIYVAGGSNSVTVIDGANNSTTTVTAGTAPYSVAVNPVTNQIYAANFGSDNVTVIDGANNNTTTVAAGTEPSWVAVNPVTNMIYVANLYSDNVTVIDGANNSTTTLAAGTNPYSVTVNPVTNKIYIANENSNNLTVIDGATNTTTTVAAGAGPVSVAVNPVTNMIYVANSNSNNVTVIDEQQVQPIPLTTSITALTNNETGSPTPSFTFSASSTTATVPDGVYFQVDTWQNTWGAATGSNPSYTGTVAPLQLGFHILYAYAVDGQEATSTQASSLLTGAIQAYGFLVTPPVPSVVSLAPSSGTGATQAFTAVYSDPNGTSDLASVRILFNTAISAANGCYVYYYPATNLMYLENNGGSGMTAGIAPGSSSTVSNSQCTLAGTGSSYSVDGNNATLIAALTFSGTFSGEKNAYMLAVGKTSNSGWVQEGTWTVPAGAPTIVSLSPSSGSGATQAFTAVYSDPNGTADLVSVRILFNTAISAVNGCYVYYDPASNLMYLENNGGSGLTAGIAPGSSSTVSNSQCTLAGTGSSYSTSGNDATLVAALTFSGTFTGAKNVYLLAVGETLNSGWVQKGTWTPIAGPPTVVSLAPSSGSGTMQAFTAVYSDPAGTADLVSVRILFNTAISAANGCYVYYYPGTNLLYLENNAGSGLTAGIAPGSSSTVSNSQCTLAGTGSSYTPSGNDATLVVALTFSGTFTGSKNVYLMAVGERLNSGWVLKGTWTP
jgi:YVTN family beta-propeller protein